MADGVSTSMDQLVGLLEKEGVVKLNDAAKDLNTDKGHIEGWAKMLEKEGVLQIHYSVIGGALIKKGPNFDKLVKATAQVKPTIAEKPRAPLVAEKTRAPEPREETRAKPAPETAGPSEEYLLIRKRITEEEQTIEANLKRLSEEQAKVIQYMATLIQEGKKLEEYIENLRKVVEKTSNGRDEQLNSIGSKV